jgi:hypothetical protein
MRFGALRLAREEEIFLIAIIIQGRIIRARQGLSAEVVRQLAMLFGRARNLGARLFLADTRQFLFDTRHPDTRYLGAALEFIERRLFRKPICRSSKDGLRLCRHQFTKATGGARLNLNAHGSQLAIARLKSV